MRESEIEGYLVKRVNAMRGEVRKVRWVGRRGAPDRIVMLPSFGCGPLNGKPYNTTLWVELKATGKEAEPHQLREHERMRRMGQRVEVVDSFKRVDEVLE